MGGFLPKRKPRCRNDKTAYARHKSNRIRFVFVWDHRPGCFELGLVLLWCRLGMKTFPAAFSQAALSFSWNAPMSSTASRCRLRADSVCRDMEQSRRNMWVSRIQRRTPLPSPGRTRRSRVNLVCFEIGLAQIPKSPPRGIQNPPSPERSRIQPSPWGHYN